jgi:hypothetical protein
MTAKTISIYRYFEFKTGIKYITSSWADFFGPGKCAEIRIKVWKA